MSRKYRSVFALALVIVGGLAVSALLTQTEAAPRPPINCRFVLCAYPDCLPNEHTEIPPSGRGKGVADALVRAALRYARERGARVMATCPYVRVWLRRHPDERPT